MQVARKARKACSSAGIAEAFCGGVPEPIQAEVDGRLDERLGAITRSFIARYPRRA